MSWLLARFRALLAPWSTALGDQLLTIERAVTITLPNRLHALENRMADVSPILNKLADDIATWSAGPFADLLAENARLRSERDAAVAQSGVDRADADALRAEDAAETSAAERAVAEWNRIVAPVSESPEVPAEIPPVEVPVPADDSQPEPAPQPEPVDAEDPPPAA